MQGYPEDLLSLGIADNSIDVVVANEIINISTDKRAIFSEVFRVLKPGGNSASQRCLQIGDFLPRLQMIPAFSEPVWPVPCTARISGDFSGE